MLLKIQKVLNGYVCTRLAEEEGDEEMTVVGKDGIKDEVADFITILREIDNYFGPSTSRYDKKRVHIIALPGDKHEETLDEEYISNLREILWDVAGSIGMKESIKFLQDKLSLEDQW